MSAYTVREIELRPGETLSIEQMLWELEWSTTGRKHCNWCNAERFPESGGPGRHRTNCPAYIALRAARTALEFEDPLAWAGRGGS